MPVNSAIASAEVDAYLRSNLHLAPAAMALKKSPFAHITPAELSAQLKGLQVARHKLPTWFSTPGVIYPPTLSLEQASSEKTARYKAGLLLGKSVIDLTAGFGIDSFCFAMAGFSVTSCEVNTQLAEILQHNAGIFGLHNFTVINNDGLQYLLSSQHTYNNVYIDPARRSDKGKVFQLHDYSPDITPHISTLLNHTQHVLVKTSPLLDVTAGIHQLSCVQSVTAVSIKNDCKELLWSLHYKKPTHYYRRAVMLNVQTFGYYQANDALSASPLAPELSVGNIIYEPDASLLKMQLHDSYNNRQGLPKLHPNTQLYTSPIPLDNYMGKVFQILNIYSPQTIKKAKKLSGNVIVRNYPGDAALLSAKYNKHATPVQYLIFCIHHTMGPIIIQATLINSYSA